jgi:hypothetical protein
MTIITLIRHVTPYSVVESYQRFEGNCCIHFPDIRVFYPEDGDSKFLRKIVNFLPTTQHHIRGDGILHSQRRESVKSR